MKRLVTALKTWGLSGVFLLALIDSAGVPIPVGVDALLIFTAATNPRTAYMAAALATLGSLVGSFILYLIARAGGERYLATHIVSPRTRRFQAWFSHYGLISLFVPLVVPIPLPAKIFVLSAGAFGVRPWQFLATVAAARVPRYFGLAILGARLGEVGAGDWVKGHVWHLVGVALALCAVLALLARWVDREPAVS